MARFSHAINVILGHEGGYSNNPNDRGGETNFGISKRRYPHLDIKNLTRDEAKAIYLRDYWNPGNYGKIRSQGVATKVFDMGVNMGLPNAAKILQAAVNHLGGKLKVDGKIGPRTLGATNALPVRKLLHELRARQALRYAQLALNDSRQKTFLEGWMRRAVE